MLIALKCLCGITAIYRCYYEDKKVEIDGNCAKLPNYLLVKNMIIPIKVIF